jgi:hypothetical protein
MGNSGATTCGGWSKCPSRKFYLELKKVFKKLREALSDSDTDDFAVSAYERNLKLFSQPHLEYILIRQFQRIRRVEQPNDQPIVWATTVWRQNQHARKACIIRFDPVVEVNAQPEDTSTTPSGHTFVEVEQQKIALTSDNFWVIIKSANVEVSFYDVFGLRIILQFISHAHRVKKGISLKVAKVVLFIEGLNITTDVDAKVFWGDVDKVKNFFKNGLFKNNKRMIDGHLDSDSNLLQLKNRCANDDKLKAVWDAVFQTIDYSQVERVYAAASRKEFDPTLPEFSILEDPGSAAGLEIDGKLTNDDTPLAPVVAIAAKEGILTRKLIQRLAKLRFAWQMNRLRFGSIVIARGEYRNSKDANTELATIHQFSTAASRMSLSKIGSETVQSQAIPIQPQL